MSDPSNPIAQYTGMSSDLRKEIDEFIKLNSKKTKSCALKNLKIQKT